MQVSAQNIDSRAEKIGYKIREAQMQKIPYMLVVGAKEEEAGVVSVRSRFAGDEGQKDLTAFMDDFERRDRYKNNPRSRKRRLKLL